MAPEPESNVARVVDAIAAHGYAIEPAFLPAAAVAALRAHALALDARGELHAAAVGRGGRRSVEPATRGDRIGWLEDDTTFACEQPLRETLEALRVALNRTLMLGLEGFEAHYAIYPAGARYARHLDRFRDDDARVLSFVLYLNDGWHAGQGGALCLYARHGALEFYPEGGTLVSFLAARFEHEVLPATRARLSLAGWFRRRG